MTVVELLEQNKNMKPTTSLDQLRAAVVRLEHGGAPADVLPFGLPDLDAALPRGGLSLAALHEVVGSGRDVEFGAAPALFVAGILARCHGPVLWVLQQRDLFAPGLAAAGLQPHRVIYAEAGRAAVLTVMEEGLRHPGLAGVVAEVSAPVPLTASRRLQLAAQAGAMPGFLLRRHHPGEGAIAAVTRWRIAPAPSLPPLAHAPRTPGLGRLLWNLELTRCRGGRTGSWVVEACDASGRLGVVPALAHGPAAPASREAWG